MRGRGARDQVSSSRMPSIPPSIDAAEVPHVVAEPVARLAFEEPSHQWAGENHCHLQFGLVLNPSTNRQTTMRGSVYDRRPASVHERYLSHYADCPHR